jgi:hypothetical protein
MANDNFTVQVGNLTDDPSCASPKTAPQSPTSGSRSTSASARPTGPGGTGRRPSSRSTPGATWPRTSPNPSAKATARSCWADCGPARGRPPRATSAPRPRSTPTKSPPPCGGRPPGRSGPNAATTANAPRRSGASSTIHHRSEPSGLSASGKVMPLPRRFAVRLSLSCSACSTAPSAARRRSRGVTGPWVFG